MEKDVAGYDKHRSQRERQVRVGYDGSGPRTEKQFSLQTCFHSAPWRETQVCVSKEASGPGIETQSSFPNVVLQHHGERQVAAPEFFRTMDRDM